MTIVLRYLVKHSSRIFFLEYIFKMRSTFINVGESRLFAIMWMGFIQSGKEMKRKRSDLSLRRRQFHKKILLWVSSYPGYPTLQNLDSLAPAMAQPIP